MNNIFKYNFCTLSKRFFSSNKKFLENFRIFTSPKKYTLYSDKYRVYHINMIYDVDYSYKYYNTVNSMLKSKLNILQYKYQSFDIDSLDILKLEKELTIYFKEKLNLNLSFKIYKIQNDKNLFFIFKFGTFIFISLFVYLHLKI